MAVRGSVPEFLRQLRVVTVNEWLEHQNRITVNLRGSSETVILVRGNLLKQSTYISHSLFACDGYVTSKGLCYIITNRIRLWEAVCYCQWRCPIVPESDKT